MRFSLYPVVIFCVAALVVSADEPAIRADSSICQENKDYTLGDFLKKLQGVYKLVGFLNDNQISCYYTNITVSEDLNTIVYNTVKDPYPNTLLFPLASIRDGNSFTYGYFRQYFFETKYNDQADIETPLILIECSTRANLSYFAFIIKEDGNCDEECVKSVAEANGHTVDLTKCPTKKTE